MELRSCHRGGDLTIGFWTKNTWLELQEAAAPRIFAFLIQQFMKAMFLLEMMISHYNVIIAQDLGKQTLALHSLKNKFVFFMMPHRKECASKTQMRIFHCFFWKTRIFVGICHRFLRFWNRTFQESSMAYDKHMCLPDVWRNRGLRQFLIYIVA